VLRLFSNFASHSGVAWYLPLASLTGRIASSSARGYLSAIAPQRIEDTVHFAPRIKGDCVSVSNRAPWDQHAHAIEITNHVVVRLVGDGNKRVLDRVPIRGLDDQALRRWVFLC
jgi:hypothetical protein